MNTVRNPIALILIFIWIGFVCAISFMEAWLKFQAPGITITLGLGIGRLVFEALNYVEWFCGLIIIATLFFNREMLSKQNLLFSIVIFLLAIQTALILPALDQRALALVGGEILPASNLHYYYVIIEIIKVACLAIFGLKQFKTQLS